MDRLRNKTSCSAPPLDKGLVLLKLDDVCRLLEPESLDASLGEQHITAKSLYYCKSIVLTLINLCAQAGILKLRFKEKTNIIQFEENKI